MTEEQVKRIARAEANPGCAGLLLMLLFALVSMVMLVEWVFPAVADGLRKGGSKESLYKRIHTLEEQVKQLSQRK